MIINTNIFSDIMSIVHACEQLDFNYELEREESNFKFKLNVFFPHIIIVSNEQERLSIMRYINVLQGTFFSTINTEKLSNSDIKITLK